MGKVTYRMLFMLGIAVTFIVCLVFRVSAAIRPGLPACIVVLFFGSGTKGLLLSPSQASAAPLHFYDGFCACCRCPDCNCSKYPSDYNVCCGVCRADNT